MSDQGSVNDRLSKNERREAARAKAQLLREEQKKKDRRNKIFLQGGIIVGSLAIVAIIALVIVNSIKPEGVGPANMASDGIQIGQGNIALATPALAPNEAPVANSRDTNSKSVNIQLYIDYLCPYCGEFEATNGAYIASLMDNGAATVEIHPIAFLDHRSQGTKYSTRATNAAACVANFSPNQFFAFHNLLFANRPPENSNGLTDDQIVALTGEAKVDKSPQITSCIKNQDFRAWVSGATARAQNGPIPNSNVTSVKGTPTVIVNGLKYDGSLSELAAFQAFVIQAAGRNFNQTSTPTPGL